MKGKMVLVAGIVCFMFLGAISSFAEGPKTNSSELGIGISSFTYQEPGVMKEEGTLLGVKGSYEHHNKLMLKAETEFGFGHMDYTGKTSIGTSLTMDGDDYKWELRGLVGYDFVCSATTLTPYTGIAYRYLNDTMGYVTDYERESNYYYSPIGLKINKKFANGWSGDITLECDILWGGQQVTHLSDIDPRYNDIENDQKCGYGYRISMKLQNKSGFGIEPYYKYWNIAQSDTAVFTVDGIPQFLLVEPQNNSQEIGIMFAMKF